MSEACRAGSSGAAEAVEEALLAGDDPGDGGGLRGWVPLPALERAAEQDPVRAREHVAEVAQRGVADLWLRLEDRQLAAHRLELGVAEQVTAAEAGAIEHQRFGQRRDVGRSGEAPHLDPAPGEPNVALHLA